jgi:mevalonate kinase
MFRRKQKQIENTETEKDVNWEVAKSPSVSKEVMDMVLTDIEHILNEHYKSLNEKDQHKLGKFMNNSDNAQIVGPIFLKIYFKQLEKMQQQNNRGYIG